MKLVDIGTEYNYIVKMVVSVNSFENYNAFFNIYNENEEPVRRILMMTKDEQIEEIMDKDTTDKINFGEIYQENVLLYEYPLTFNPNKLNINELEVSKEEELILREVLKGEEK